MSQVLGPNQLKIVEALKSGLYTQTKYAMRSSDENGKDCFCVLGLIAHLFNLRHGLIFIDGQNGIVGLYNDSGRLKESIKIGEYTYGCIMYMNDGDADGEHGGLTFEQIADLMEKDPSLFFAYSV